MMFSKKLCDFSHLIGNREAKEILSRLIAHETVPQVLLFYGPRGVGKGLFAQQVAKALLETAKDEHPDLHLLQPDPESNQHSIASLRNLIEETALPPFQAPCKVFILHDVEKMLTTSSNTLLKTLEEPPADTQFILVTSEPTSLLPTILSRCSKVPFHGVSDEELTQFLAEKHHVPDAKKIALLSEGSVSAALIRYAHPAPLLPLDSLFKCSSYADLHPLLKDLSDEVTPQETDRLFEEMLFWIREHDPLCLDEAVPLISEARIALFHHLKFKNVLERFFIRYLFLK